MYRVGIDLGGTNIAVGLVNDDYEIISYTTVPTEAWRSADEVVATMAQAVNTVLDQAGLKAEDCVSIGVGAPGTCDVQNGVVYRSYSMNWTDLPLAQMMGKHFSIPVLVDNDANCAALAEVKAGAAKGKENIVLVTLGTGIGSGIVLGGRIFSGLKGNGAEMGHMMIHLEGTEVCFCGRKGCWDSFASATALVHQAEAAAKEHPESLLNNVEKIDGKSVFDAADNGDSVAQAVIDQYCQYLAIGISNIVNALAPEMILVGGGISRQGDRILAPVRKYVAENCFDKRPEALPEIMPAQMGNEAGIVGAAALS